MDKAFLLTEWDFRFLGRAAEQTQTNNKKISLNLIMLVDFFVFIVAEQCHFKETSCHAESVINITD